MNVTAIRGLFVVATLYDGILGLLFLIVPGWAFTQFDIPPPNHFGYVQFPAALLMIFSLMFLRVAQDPHKHAPLIIYGILLKIAYCSVTFGPSLPWRAAKARPPRPASGALR